MCLNCYVEFSFSGSDLLLVTSDLRSVGHTPRKHVIGLWDRE